MSMNQNNGTNTSSDNFNHSDIDSRRLTYKQVGTIQLLRGNRFVISLDEHKLPEGTRSLYVRVDSCDQYSTI